MRETRRYLEAVWPFERRAELGVACPAGSEEKLAPADRPWESDVAKEATLRLPADGQERGRPPGAAIRVGGYPPKYAAVQGLAQETNWMREGEASAAVAWPTEAAVWCDSGNCLRPRLSHNGEAIQKDAAEQEAESYLASYPSWTVDSCHPVAFGAETAVDQGRQSTAVLDCGTIRKEGLGRHQAAPPIPVA